MRSRELRQFFSLFFDEIIWNMFGQFVIGFCAFVTHTHTNNMSDFGLSVSSLFFICNKKKYSQLNHQDRAGCSNKKTPVRCNKWFVARQINGSLSQPCFSTQQNHKKRNQTFCCFLCTPYSDWQSESWHKANEQPNKWQLPKRQLMPCDKIRRKKSTKPKQMHSINQLSSLTRKRTSYCLFRLQLVRFPSFS